MDSEIDYSVDGKLSPSSGDAILRQEADARKGTPIIFSDTALPSMTDIKNVEPLCTTLANATPDQIAEVRGFLAFIYEEYKRIKKTFDETMIERIKADPSRYIIIPGNVRLYIGTPPKYKARNPAKLINAILLLCAGDLEEAGKCLSSDWFKKSEIELRCEDVDERLVNQIRLDLQLDLGTDKEPAPSLFDQLIETIRGDKLEEGKPLKEPKLHVDTGYRRGGGHKTFSTGKPQLSQQDRARFLK